MSPRAQGTLSPGWHPLVGGASCDEFEGPVVVRSLGGALRQLDPERVQRGFSNAPPTVSERSRYDLKLFDACMVEADAVEIGRYWPRELYVAYGDAASS